jgi:hypothetical protein
MRKYSLSIFLFVISLLFPVKSNSATIDVPWTPLSQDMRDGGIVVTYRAVFDSLIDHATTQLIEIPRNTEIANVFIRSGTDIVYSVTTATIIPSVTGITPILLPDNYEKLYGSGYLGLTLNHLCKGTIFRPYQNTTHTWIAQDSFTKFGFYELPTGTARYFGIEIDGTCATSSFSFFVTFRQKAGAR